MTQADKPKEEARAVFQRVISVLDHVHKILDTTGSSQDLLSGFKNLIRYLRSLSEEEKRLLISGKALVKPTRPESIEAIPSDKELSSLTLDQVQSLISNQLVKRKVLERVAAVRFGVTRGGISSLPNREALREKLETLIRNENTHGAIIRVAESKDKDTST